MVTRSALPQNYVKRASTLHEDFQDIDGVVVTNSSSGVIPSKEVDLVNFRRGAQGIKVSGSVTNSTFLRADLATTLDWGTFPTLELFAYFEELPSSVLGAVVVYIQTKSSWSHMLAKEIPVGSLHQGLNSIFFDLIGATVTGTPDLAQVTTIRVGFLGKSATATVPHITLEEIDVGGEYRHNAVLAYDDGAAAQYSVFFPYHRDVLGIPGTIYLIYNKVGTAGYITWAQIDEMYDEGWAVGNHTMDHSHLNTLSLADQIAQIAPVTENLLASGYTRGARHVAYPYGDWNADTLLAMAQSDVLTGRSTAPGHVKSATNMYLLNANSPASTGALTAYLRPAQRGAGTYMMLYHDGPVTDGITVETIEGYYQEIANGHPDFQTIDEWYNGLTNPRYRSLPVGRA